MSKALSTPYRKSSSVNVRAQRNARWDWTRKDSSIERHRSFRRWDWSRETLDFERLCKRGTSSPWARIRESHAQRSADPYWSGENFEIERSFNFRFSHGRRILHDGDHHGGGGVTLIILSSKSKLSFMEMEHVIRQLLTLDRVCFVTFLKSR